MKRRCGCLDQGGGFGLAELLSALIVFSIKNLFVFIWLISFHEKVWMHQSASLPFLR